MGTERIHVAKLRMLRLHDHISRFFFEFVDGNQSRLVTSRRTLATDPTAIRFARSILLKTRFYMSKRDGHN